jgi:SAM-dependent methyltransferase
MKPVPLTPLDFSQYVPAGRYDLIYSWMRADVGFYVAQALEAGGPVLEVGCGTGRVLIPTLEAGADIDGFDIQPAMLEELRTKANLRGLEPRVFEADMRDFTMPRRYELVTIPFRAFMHVLEIDEQIRTLRCCREHLEPGGRLILNLFYPSFDRIVAPPGAKIVEREFAHPDTGRPVTITSTVEYDRVAQLLNAEVEVLEGGAEGMAGTTTRYRFTLRWIFRHEMELLLRLAGFTHYEVAGDFDGRRLINDTDEMVWTAWKD